MDLASAAEKLIKPVTEGVANLLAPKVAEVVSDLLKQEILEAQKYRIDKEFDIKRREQNLKSPNFCPNCDCFTNEKVSVMIEFGPHTIYKCNKCSFEIPLRSES